MPDTQVSILKRDGTQSSYYSTYALARTAAVSGDVIRIWANLTERIGLINGVDVWINEGVIIKSNDSNPTIYEFSGAVNCNIYGGGIIKNESSSKCIQIVNANTELRIECNSIIGTNPTHASSTAIEIQKSKKFHLTCSEVQSDVVGFVIGSTASGATIDDLNLKIEKIETGISNNNVTSTSLITFANGFINIGEIKCNEKGHCYSHRGGDIIAKIKR